ncbi:MAG: phenylacetate--CoA ligase family protein [Colwellia sp.]|nr:phenylacetate--CoA ligase family protein [Colwellia sp.]
MKNFQGVLKELEYSFENVEFYQELFYKTEVDINKIKTPDDLEQIPFTSKIDYRRSFPKGTLAKGFNLSHPMIASHRSSGSTGERLTTLEIGMHLLDRAISCAQINPSINNAFHKVGRKIARYAAPNCSDVECANPNSSIEDRILPDQTLVLPVYHDLLTTTEQMLDRTLEEINEYQPDLFYVDPTHFAFLLRHYKKRGLTPPNIPVMVAYTGATDCARRQIAEFYDMNSMYGELLSSTEFGWVAMECNHGHLHANDDSFFFEYVDVEFESPLENTFKELCISSIDQGASPHIRYRTGDVASVTEGPCDCGSDRVRFVMEGKFSQFLVKDGRPFISPQQVDKMIGGPAWLDLYQLEQVKDTEFLLKIIANDSYQQGDEAYFIEQLTDIYNTNLKVDVSFVDYIASERSGKYQFVRGLNNNV